jgi:hypothetical protein
MRQSGGRSWMCLAPLVMLACSSADPPPPEGSVRCTVHNSHPCNISGGVAPQMDNSIMGNTVLDGRSGYHVDCNISGSGTYSLSASISAPDQTSVTVSGEGIGATNSPTVAMYIMATTGEVNNLGDTKCTLKSPMKALEPGSIWASFHCSNLASPSNIGSEAIAGDGEFLFTGCAR